MRIINNNSSVVFRLDDNNKRSASMVKTQLHKKKMSFIESLVFVLMFVMPFPISAMSPPERNNTLLIAFFSMFLLLFAFRWKYLKKVIISGAIYIVGVYIIGALLKYLAYGYWLTVPSMFLPLVGFFGYYYIDDKRIDLRVFDILLIGLYVFFILTYYIFLPSLFFREAFDDGNWYGSSSANVIAIVLVNVLYIYQVLTYQQKEDRSVKLLFFSSINLFLIIIQQSRAGILLSLLFVVWNLFRIGRVKGSRTIKIVTWLVILFGVYWIFSNNELITQYTDVVGDMSTAAYEKDGRNSSLLSFFSNMDSYKFFFGYPFVTDFENNGYTFNIFADHWNRYTFLGFVVLILILLNRVIHRKKYYFPLYYLIPFLLYGWVEPRYLPNYWDFFIYLMLFKKCESPRHIVVLSKSQQVM